MTNDLHDLSTYKLLWSYHISHPHACKSLLHAGRQQQLSLAIYLAAAAAVVSSSPRSASSAVCITPLTTLPLHLKHKQPPWVAVKTSPEPHALLYAASCACHPSFSPPSAGLTCLPALIPYAAANTMWSFLIPRTATNMLPVVTVRV